MTEKDEALTQQMFVEDEDEKNKEQEDTRILEDGDVSNILDLPSRGQLGYPSTVSYRDILVKDEEVLSAATIDTYARTLNKVLKSILNDCEFFEDMCVHDRDFLLVWMWAFNYSPTKKVDLKCPSCEHEFSHVVDFTKQEVTDIDSRFKGTYEMNIKKSDKPISVRLNTVGDENITEQFIAKNKDHRYEHVMMVLSIDFGANSLPVKERVKWVQENLSGPEMTKIKKFHTLLKFGIDSMIDYKCPECEEVFQSPFPFQAEDILFPTVQADIEEFL